MHLEMSSAKWRPFCLGLNVLKLLGDVINTYWHTDKNGYHFVDVILNELFDKIYGIFIQISL